MGGQLCGCRKKKEYDPHQHTVYYYYYYNSVGSFFLKRRPGGYGELFGLVLYGRPANERRKDRTPVLVYKFAVTFSFYYDQTVVISHPTTSVCFLYFYFIFSEGNYWPRAFSASHSPISQRNQSIWTTICRRATKGFSSSLSFFPVYCLIYKMPTKPKDIYIYTLCMYIYKGKKGRERSACSSLRSRRICHQDWLQFQGFLVINQLIDASFFFGGGGGSLFLSPIWPLISSLVCFAPCFVPLFYFLLCCFSSSLPSFSILLVRFIF